MINPKATEAFTDSYNRWKTNILQKTPEEIFNLSYLISLVGELSYYFENTEDIPFYDFTNCVQDFENWYWNTFNTIKIGSSEDNEEWILEFFEDELTPILPKFKVGDKVKLLTIEELCERFEMTKEEVWDIEMLGLFEELTSFLGKVVTIEITDESHEYRIKESDFWFSEYLFADKEEETEWQHHYTYHVALATKF